MTKAKPQQEILEELIERIIQGIGSPYGEGATYYHLDSTPDEKTSHLDYPEMELMNEPFTDHSWREKPCGCKQLYVEGLWENRYRCDKHQKMVDAIERKI